MTTTTPPCSASAHQTDGKQHLLLCVTGSVATIKIPLILHSLSRHPSLSIRLIFTKSASQFLQGQSAEQPHLSSLLSITNVDSIFYDEDEWARSWKRGEPILHIELRRWADLMAIVPLSANALAKIVGGLSEGLVGSLVRAWDTRGSIDVFRWGGRDEEGEGERKKKLKRILVAPAMNSAMWNHPVTEKQIGVLEKEWGVGRQDGDGEEREGWFRVLRPMEKVLACGDVGEGAMKEWSEVVGVIEEELGLKGKDEG